jgi:type IV pilus assembly protein PilW
MTFDQVRLTRAGRQQTMGRVRQRGLSLVELLVALTVGLFLLGAVGSIYVATSQSTRGSTQEAQMNEDATLALEILQQQFRLAGFSGLLPDNVRRFTGAPLFGCDGDFDDVLNVDNFAALTCDNNADNTDPDAFVIRYEATTLNSQEVGVGVPANCIHVGIDAWDPAPDAAANTRLAENRFFIAPDPNNGNIPSLRCRGRSGAGFSGIETVIPNVVDMQVQYAVTRLPVAGEVLPHQITGYRRAWELNAAAPGAWSRVAGARICLVVQTNEVQATLPDALRQYRDCAGAVQTAPAGFQRRAFVATTMARNLRPGVPETFSGNNPWNLILGVTND